MLFTLAHHVEKAGGIITDFVAQFAQGDEFAGARRHLRLLTVAIENGKLYQQYIQLLRVIPECLQRQLQEKQLDWDKAEGNAGLATLIETHEQELMISLSRYPEVLEAAADSHEPHQLTYYLRELANDFHTYYNAHTFLVEDSALRNARLNLIEATRQVIANGLGLLGVSAPDTM